MNSSTISSDIPPHGQAPGASRRLAVLLSTLAVTLVSIAGVNALVDPFGVFTMFGVDGLRAYESKRGSRTAKAADLARGGFGVVFFGSSRTETGFDPRLEFIPDQPGYNAALAGTSMWEMGHVFRHATAHNPARTAVFALDFFMFAEGRGDFDDFLSSGFNPDRDKAAHTLDLLLSQRAIAATAASIRSALSGTASNYDDAGFRAGGMVETSRTSIEISRARIRGFRNGIFADYIFDERAFDEFAGIVDACTRDERTTIILIPPIHALHLELIRDAGLWDEFQGFKRRLASLASAPQRGGAVRVYDFTGYSRFTTEPLPLDDPDRPMRWHWETSHFRAELGEMALRIAFGVDTAADGSSFGRSLDAGSIEDHLLQIGHERDVWAESAGPDLAWFADVLARR